MARCRAHISKGPRAGEPCSRPAKDGAVVCTSHGARAPQVRAAAERRVAERKAREAVAALGQIVPGSVDPLDVLDQALSEVVALKDRLGQMVARLADESVRYEGRAGEQLRGELAAYQSALRDTTKCAETIVKLGLDERRVRLSEIQVAMMATGIRNILGDLDLTPSQQQLAAVAVPKRLRELEGRASEARIEQEQHLPYQGRRRSRELANL